MHMGMLGFTRLTNGFSKKIQNFEFAVALHFMYYNSGRIHKSLRARPTREAGITYHFWMLEEIADLNKYRNILYLYENINCRGITYKKIVTSSRRYVD